MIEKNENTQRDATRRKAEEADRTFVARFAEHRRIEMAQARAVALVNESKFFLEKGFSSLGAYGVDVGYTTEETYRLAALGRTVTADPTLVKAVEQGELPMQSASNLDEVRKQPALAPRMPEFVDKAKKMSAGEFKRLVREEVAKARGGPDPMTSLTFWVKVRVGEDFDRARTVASNKAGRVLNRDEAFEAIVDRFLEDHDPLRVRCGKRKMGDTTEMSGRRVPAETKHKVLARRGDRCAFPGCDWHVFNQFAHMKAVHLGGHGEAHNIVRLCPRHHVMYDAGIFRIEGSAENPVFRWKDGRLITGDKGAAHRPPRRE